MPSNRESCVKAIHSYIDTLDDDGIYNLITNEEVIGPHIFDCKACEAKYPESSSDNECNSNLCKKRFNEWINE